MNITIKSSLSGKANTMDIPTSRGKLDEWAALIQSGDAPHIQVFWPELTPEQREFLLTGITPAEWAAVFGSED